MSYRSLKEKLLDEFNRNEKFKNLYQEKKKDSWDIERLSNEKILGVEYPGYKTRTDNGDIIKYDYAVYLKSNNKPHKIKHTEIIEDLYCKGKILDKHGKIDLLYNFIYELAEKGDDVDISKYKEIDNLCKDKTHFTIEELAKVISLIALQEDINYPRNKKRKDGSYYEGRKMPFYRFAEAIYCSHKDDHIIREVINRATIKKSTSSKKWENVNPNFYEEIDKRVKDQI